MTWERTKAGNESSIDQMAQNWNVQPNFPRHFSGLLPPPFISSSTMLCQFLPYSEVTQSVLHMYIHTSLFLNYLSSRSIPRDWTQFPVLYSRTSLPIHPKYNSWHLITLVPQTPGPSCSLPRQPLATPGLCFARGSWLQEQATAKPVLLKPCV